jgi:hypothetical protein
MMKKTLSIIAIAVVSCGWSFAADPVGKIVSVKGEAYVAHVLKAKVPAVVGESIFDKDKIKTGADGEVVIDMLGESKLTVSPNSYMKIPTKTSGAEGGTELALFGGKVGFEVKPLGEAQSFTVRSPSAVAGVRGTKGEMSYDLDSGVTGAQSMPHTDGTNAKSIVYTAPPEDKDKLNESIHESKMAEKNGQTNGAPEGIMVVNEGQAGFYMANGDSMLVEMEAGSDLNSMGQKVAKDIKDGNAVQQAQGRFANMSADRIAYLEDLENRVNKIDANRVDTRLPGPGAEPQ